MTIVMELPIISTPPKGRQKAKKRKPRREELPKGANLCEFCTAKCCHYFALPLDTPKTWSDFDTIRWFLIHDGATVFTEDDTWYLMVFSKCKHLRDDNLCGIYHTRPEICRKYSTRNCEYEDDWVYDRYIEVPEQVEEYAEAVLGPRGRKSIRGPKPKVLPVLAIL
jgi:Fe-S-cluster containining protein